MHVTTDMGALGRTLVQHTVFVAIGSNLRQAIADNGTFSGLQLVDGFQLARREVFHKILNGRDVLGDEVFCGSKRDAGRVVKTRPGTVFAGDQSRQKQATCNAVGETLPKIAGMNEDMLVAGIAAYESRIIDRDPGSVLTNDA